MNFSQRRREAAGHFRPHPYSPGPIAWGEIAPGDHLVQFYEDDAQFLDTLEAYVADGLTQMEGVVLIATPGHLEQVNTRLRLHGVDVDAAAARGQYLSADAADTLAQFMIDGWPDEARFHRAVGGLLARGRSGGRRVRAFGEMVALLCRQGQHEAVLRLEQLWTRLCVAEKFPLFCAYPRSEFVVERAGAAFQHICDAHTRVLRAA